MKYLEIKYNKLYIDGVSCVALAEKYGTPLYVFSENEMRGRLRELKECFIDRYPGTRVAYASKAFLCKAMAGLVHDEGMCLDVVSAGEL